MDVLSTIFHLYATPSDMLHAHYVITINLNQLAVMWATRYAHMNRTKLQIPVEKHFLMLLELHINLSPMYHQTECCAIC